MADKNLVALKSVIVVRDGRRVSPPVGKAFPFSADEADAMKEGIDYRKAINEDEQADLASLAPLGRSPHVGKARTNAQGAGNTTAMVDGLDGTARSGDQGQGGAGEGDTLAGNVNSVKTAVAAMTDKDALATMRETETTGQNRAGVLAAIDARVTALTPDDDL